MQKEWSRKRKERTRQGLQDGTNARFIRVNGETLSQKQS